MFGGTEVSANINELTKSFYHKGNSIGILLIHGFCSTPAEMRELGDFLKDKGYTVKAILLKGHGSTIADMKKTNYRDWIKSAVEGYKTLKYECDQVFAVGLSMGGLLSLYLARNFDVKGVISLSTPIKVLNRRNYIDFTKSYFSKRKNRIKELKDMMYKCNSNTIIGYDKAPLISIYNLFRLIRYIKNNLTRINKPILIMQSYRDRIVNPISANIIYKRIASTDKSIVYLHRSGHIVTSDCDKERVFSEVDKFIIEKQLQY